MSAPDHPPILTGRSRAAALAAVRAYLQSAGIAEAEADARLLFFAAAGADALGLLREPERRLSDAEAARVAEFAQRRVRREPASRIVGRRPFWTLDLAVWPDVLDPRADSEALIRLATRMARARGVAPGRILDVGSGSGALICAVLDEFPAARGVAIDLSMDACLATRANLAANGFAGRSAVVRGNWLGSLKGPFDLVVSNPPYIATGEIDGLDLEVRRYDPHVALDGGSDGLDAYRRLFPDCIEILSPSGFLVVEHGAGQAEALLELAEAKGLVVSGAERDLGGRERAIALTVASSRSQGRTA